MSTNIQSFPSSNDIPYSDLGMKKPNRTEGEKAFINATNFLQNYSRTHASVTNNLNPSLKTKVCTWIANHRVATNLILAIAGAGTGMLINYLTQYRRS